MFLIYLVFLSTISIFAGMLLFALSIFLVKRDREKPAAAFMRAAYACALPGFIGYAAAVLFVIFVFLPAYVFNLLCDPAFWRRLAAVSIAGGLLWLVCRMFFPR